MTARKPTRAAAGEPLAVPIDFARTSGGVFRRLHGVNKGPLAAGGLVDVSEGQRALDVPHTRLHDCHWPNPDVVDMHAVFPDLRADPRRAGSYDFARTDEYLAAVRATGAAQIIYRLGESIEHTRTKRFVHPPSDPEKWAAVALGIIRHYNEGWANGYRYAIRYWEIWNEPENRPAMWTGTDEDYFRLYQTAARAIKSRYPNLLVGGPAVGNPGGFVAGAFQPSAFVTAFLAFCRRERAPLDFFSWHCYTTEPAELVARAVALRRLLDAHGFAKTESHLNEWNYLPGNRWDPVARSASPGTRQRFYEEMGGAPGAAFVAAALLRLQDAPVDVCCLFHGEVGAFGLFTEHGLPTKSYHALRAFRELLDTPRRVETPGSLPAQIAVGAGLAADAQRAAVLVSNIAHPRAAFRLELKNLPWGGVTEAELRLVDAAHDFQQVRPADRLEPPGIFAFDLKAPAVALVTLRPAETTKGAAR